MERWTRRHFLGTLGLAPVVAGCKGEASRPASLRSTEDIMDPWIEVSQDHLEWNLQQIRERAGNRPVMAVIKANGYGHGLVGIAELLEKMRIHAVAVGKVDEAMQLREHGIRVPILNFGPYTAKQAEDLVRFNISQSVFSDSWPLLTEAVEKLNGKLRVQVKVDTGLGRVGIHHSQAIGVIEQISSHPGVTIDGIFTALTEEPVFDTLQLERLQGIVDTVRSRGVPVSVQHAASSAALISFPQARLDLVRPGITLYGEYPSTEEYKKRRIDLKSVMTMKARVSLVKTLNPGDSISYHRAFTARKKMRVATLPVGYSDGYPPQVGSKGSVLIGGHRCPMLTSVTSNHMIVDVTESETITVGDEVVLLGRQEDASISAEEIAAWAGTSVYKILINMNPLLPRTIV